MNIRTLILFTVSGLLALSACSTKTPVRYANDTTIDAHQAAAAGQKPRVIVMTDAETDDRCSMVHFLLYANDMQVDAIIQSNSCFQKHGWSTQPWLEEQISAYEKMYPNLIVHDEDYPTADYLRSVVFIGDENPEHISENWNARTVVEGEEVTIDPSTWEDTPGSDRIVEVLLEQDPRPVFLQAWGGANTAARAFDKIKSDYPDQYERALSKAVIYCIWYQDQGGAYIEQNHPLATILLNHHFSGSWDYGTMINSDNFVGQYLQNGKNPLGAFYTQPYISEGDSPSFLYSVENGLRSYEDPTYGGWGGRFYKLDGYDRLYRDTGFGELREWMEAAMHDFQARLKWGETAEYSKANHHPQISFPEGQDRTVSSGETVTLKVDVEDNDAPDVDAIWRLRQQMFEQQGTTFDIFKKALSDPAYAAHFAGTSINWYQYQAGTFPGIINLKYSEDKTVSFVAPEVDAPQTIHIIAEVTDNGFPSLTSYARFIIRVEPSK